MIAPLSGGTILVSLVLSNTSRSEFSLKSSEFCTFFDSFAIPNCDLPSFYLPGTSWPDNSYVHFHSVVKLHAYYRVVISGEKHNPSTQTA